MKLLNLLENRPTNSRIIFKHSFAPLLRNKGYKVIIIGKLDFNLDNKYRIKVIRETGKMKIYDFNTKKQIRIISIRNENDAVKKLSKFLKSKTLLKRTEIDEEYRDKSQTYFRFVNKRGKGPFAGDRGGPSNSKIIKRFTKIGVGAPDSLVRLIGYRGKFYFTSYGYKKVKNYMRHYQVIRKKIPDSMIIYRDKFQIIAIEPGEQEWFKRVGWPDIKDKEFRRKVNAIGNERSRRIKQDLKSVSSETLHYLTKTNKSAEVRDLVDKENKRRKRN